MASHDPRWLDWTRRLQAIAQTGRAYTSDVYDRERFDAIEQIAAEILSTHTAVDIDAVRALWEHEEGYATPKIDVRGVVFRYDAVLLVRELSDGRWTLPGGWADVQSSPAENVVREIQEESGILTHAVKLLAVYDRGRHGHVPLAPHHVYKMFFRCEIIAHGPLESVETSEAAFFREHELPELSMGRVVPAQIHRFFEHLRNPEWPTDFD